MKFSNFTFLYICLICFTNSTLGRNELPGGITQHFINPNENMNHQLNARNKFPEKPNLMIFA